MWNDTDVPRAFLITFRCRGTWVHGDGRGSVDRNNNIFGTTRLPENSNWKRYNESQLKGAPSYLTARQRTIVELAIRETCSVRNWHLHAVNVRTNHVHAVVAAGTASNSSVIHALKANSTRGLREKKCWPYVYSPWSDKGSMRMLWNENSVALAMDYVLNGQGDDLPKFE